METDPQTKNSLFLSYMTLRQLIGYLGITLPFVVSLGACWIFKDRMQPSISGYYYTGIRDVFVGMLCAIGIFLFSYRAFGKADDIAGNLACLFALGVAWFPTAPVPEETASASARLIGHFHLGFAALFFLTLSYFCLFLFTKTDSPNPTRRKRQRNGVYRFCGGVMIACLVAMVIVHLLPKASQDWTDSHHIIFWLESVAIVFFGISWLTKGEAILGD